VNRNRLNVKEVIYNDRNTTNRKPARSVMTILRENNDESMINKEMTRFNNFDFPKDMRVTSNILEMHPQIIKDKLRISKIIHKYYDPTLYDRDNIRNIKRIMKLDNAEGDDAAGNLSLLKPYSKQPTGLQALREKKAKLKLARPERSVNIDKEEPLAKLILDDFKAKFERGSGEVQGHDFLQKKNKLFDFMDDYYSRHISKVGYKPEHLFMFKAKPIIPPGRILLEIERERERLNIVSSKIRVGNSEVSVFSPIHLEKGYFDFEHYTKTHEVRILLQKIPKIFLRFLKRISVYIFRLKLN
jgi:hypothetical protein